MKLFRGTKSNVPFLILIFVALCLFCAVFSGLTVGEPSIPPAPPTGSDPATDEGTPVPQTTEPVTTEPVTEPVTDPITDPVTEPLTEPPVTEPPAPLPPFAFPNQLAESAEVGDDYFADALFIGDSRTVGFQMSTSLDATFYAKVSLNIGQLDATDEKSRFINVNTDGGTVKCNVYEALEHNAGYAKVYLCMGLSELGWDEPSFMFYYRKTLDHLREKLPGAKIYIQTMIPVTTERSAQELYGVTNERLWQYNRALAALAAEYGVYLVNPAERFSEPDGSLPPAYSWDGVHLYGDYYRQWLGYLRTHTAV